jgi:hypothetical protein
VLFFVGAILASLRGKDNTGSGTSGASPANAWYLMVRSALGARLEP